MGYILELRKLVGSRPLFSVGAYVYPNGDQIYNVAAIFLARGASGTLQPDHESLELGWFAADSLPSPLVGPITRWMAAQLPELVLEQF
jgi:hypothetical protein